MPLSPRLLAPALGALLLFAAAVVTVAVTPRGVPAPTARAVTSATAAPSLHVTATPRPTPVFPLLQAALQSTAAATPTEPATPTPEATGRPSPHPTVPTATAVPAPAAVVPTSPTPLAVQDAPGTTAHCVILAYHYIPPKTFLADQFAALKAAGFQVVPLEQLVQYVSGHAGTTLPLQCYAITFDDGWRSQYLYARPVLLADRLPATFFVITTYLDQGYSAYLTWPMAEQLVADGFDVEDHTRTHPRLDLLAQRSVAGLRDEIVGSVQDLEAHIGPTHRIFNYPYGSYNATVVDMVAHHNAAAVQLAGSGLQRPDERYLLHRVMVEPTEAPSRVVATVRFLEQH